MAVIFAGGELSSFTKFNAIETTTDGSFAAPARCGIHTKKGGYIRTDTLSGVSDVWLHFDMSTSLITAGLVPIAVSNSSGVVLFSITSDGKIMAETTQAGIIPLFNAPGRHTIDIHLRGGSQGQIEIYADNQVLFSANGSYAFNAMQTLTLSPAGTDASTVTNTIYSQVIVANEVTIGSKLATLVLQSVGSNNSWLGTSADAAADVNEIVLDDNTYISATNAGQIETWTVSDLAPQYTNIRAVIISALGKYSTTGPKNLDAVTKLPVGTYFQPMTTLGPGYTPSQTILNINPVTNSAWLAADVNAAEFGIRSKV